MVALPTGDKDPIPLISISQTAATHLRDVAAMLRKPEEVEAEIAQPCTRARS